MNRREFMVQLKKYLRKLPSDETQEVVAYYEQYFDEAGEENEQAVLAELGAPASVAAQIIADYAVKDAGGKTSAGRGLSTVWLVILAVLASPIALPLALVVVVLALTLVIVLLAVIISVGATGLGLLLGGIASAVSSIFFVTQSLATSLFYLGVGLFAVAAGLTLCIATVALSKKCFSWLAKLIGIFILRRSEK